MKRQTAKTMGHGCGTALIILGAAVMLATFASIGLFLRWTGGSTHVAKAKKDHQEIVHPRWSKSIHYSCKTFPNGGSGDHSTLYLIDARKTDIPMNEAIAYYESEVVRLKLKKYQVTAFQPHSNRGTPEQEKWRLAIPTNQPIFVISHYRGEVGGKKRAGVPSTDRDSIN